MPDNIPTPPHRGDWQGPTYYGRSQLKPAPFENWVVGGYIFLAGLSGASALIAAIADLAGGPREAALVRRGRYLSLLAPTLGSALLVYDLHTPKRFYNMLRIAKPTSPMSIGTWILVTFTGFAGISAVAQFVADRLPGLGWLRGAARVTQVPAAATGAGLCTYTAALLSATSTPLWAAAPRSLAVRLGAASVASGAAALSALETRPRSRRALDRLTLAALTAELAATAVSHRTYARTGVAPALDGRWGQVERIGATGFGTLLPLGMKAASLALARRRSPLSRAASLAVLAGSLLLRVSIMGAGDESAARPEVSLRFAGRENLPRV
jgi:formate-dependent nitrite reductase membrane component NrfD